MRTLFRVWKETNQMAKICGEHKNCILCLNISQYIYILLYQKPQRNDVFITLSSVAPFTNMV